MATNTALATPPIDPNILAQLQSLQTYRKDMDAYSSQITQQLKECQSSSVALQSQLGQQAEQETCMEDNTITWFSAISFMFVSVAITIVCNMVIKDKTNWYKYAPMSFIIVGFIFFILGLSSGICSKTALYMCSTTCAIIGFVTYFMGFSDRIKRFKTKDWVTFSLIIILFPSGCIASFAPKLKYFAVLALLIAFILAITLITDSSL
jgi:hypothetical protein